MIVASRDPFGKARVVYAGDAFASSVAALQRARLRLDPEAIAGHLRRAPLSDRTIFAGVRQLPPGHALVRTDAGLAVTSAPIAPRAGELGALLRASIARCLASGKRVAVALSGGLDSAVVLAIARQLDPGVPAYVVAPSLPGYSELERAERTATRLGAELHVVPAGEADLRAALLPALVAIEEPLYNLHPVERLLLGRALRRDGVELALTGDGVDQVMRRDASADYVPLVHALLYAAGVTPHAPFLDDGVVAHLLALPPDPDKRCVRALGAALGLDEGLTHAPKRSRLAPPIELGVDERELAAFSRAPDERTTAACLALLARHFEAAL